MPITVEWDDDARTIIRSTVSGKWTWEEYNAAVDAVLALANSVEHRVDLITDSAAAAVIPRGPAAPHIQRLRRLRPPHFKMIVVVRPHAFTKMMIETVNRSTQTGSDVSVITNTLEDAYAIVHQARAADHQAVEIDA